MSRYLFLLKIVDIYHFVHIMNLDVTSKDFPLPKISRKVDGNYRQYRTRCVINRLCMERNDCKEKRRKKFENTR